MKRNLADFLNDSPTSYQAIDNVREELLEQGFTELNEASKYDIKAGGNYFVTRNESAIIAFTIPENFTGIRIVASHSDSPYFKVKENPEMKKGGSYCVLNVEKYGGMLQSPWFDRPLSVAGRIFVEEDGALVSKHVDLEKPMCMIPSLAIHMDREANNGRAFNPQKDLLPLMGMVSGDETPKLLDQVAAKAGTKADAILGYDLYVYNNEKAIIWGENDDFISGPRLDDLQCVYTSLVGFLNGARSEALSIYTVFDNEEVGS
jgi:aspartyl aminopeptidase